jgi:peptide/nickel transport system permease protein
MLARLLRHRLALVGLLIIGCMLLAALLAPVLASEHPNQRGIWRRNTAEARQPPSPAHPLGTDQLGRDMLSRILYGGRISLAIGVASVGLAIVAGTLLGSISGYVGGWTDTLIMRFMDSMLAFPAILLALAIVVARGPGIYNVMLAVGTVSIPVYARIVRASVLGESNKEYVLAAVALGVPRWRILFRHLLPNSLSPLIVAASLGVGTAILDAAALSFLGLGAQPPQAEWGLLLGGGSNRQQIFSGWWIVAFPGLAIMLSVLGFNLLGDGLRDVLDPRLRGGRA